MRRVDVLIIGGGPAGSTCAYRLAKSGAEVLVVDIKHRIGSPVQCAEFVPIQLSQQFKEFFPQEVISQRVKNMLHLTPWGETVSMWSEGFVLNRELFDANIAHLAQRHGAQYMLRTRLLGFEDGKVVLEHIPTREKLRVSASLVVGADGPMSKVARLTGRHTQNFLTTAQVTLRLKVRLDDLVVYFRDYIPGGYGWIFPKGSLANVGVGIDPSYPINVMESLRMFLHEVEKDGWVEKEIFKRTGGWIPADGLLDVLRGRFMLVGDAGGFCHPITGGGIANAVLSGDACAKAIAEGRLEEFEEYAEDTLSTTLRRASQKRKKYMKSWDNLREIIPKTWIAFKEYWTDETVVGDLI